MVKLPEKKKSNKRNKIQATCKTTDDRSIEKHEEHDNRADGNGDGHNA